MDDRSRTHVTKDLTRSGPFPLSAVTSARLPRVTTPPGSSKDRGKTSCPQQLAQPRTTRDHQQGNGEDDFDSDIDLLVTPSTSSDLFDLALFVDDVERLTGFPTDVVSDSPLPA